VAKQEPPQGKHSDSALRSPLFFPVAAKGIGEMTLVISGSRDYGAKVHDRVKI
jgi:hypothetical protein